MTNTSTSGTNRGVNAVSRTRNVGKSFSMIVPNTGASRSIRGWMNAISGGNAAPIPATNCSSMGLIVTISDPTPSIIDLTAGRSATPSSMPMFFAWVVSCSF